MSICTCQSGYTIGDPTCPKHSRKTETRTPLPERIRLRAALTVLEDLVQALDEHPASTSLETPQGRRLASVKHKAQAELFKAYRLNEI